MEQQDQFIWSLLPRLKWQFKTAEVFAALFTLTPAVEHGAQI
jgi:hypothetical protein